MNAFGENRMKSVYTWLRSGVAVAALISFAGVQSAWGAFHFMQIEQIIGGVNGDTTAQAIQLRMRSSGQNFVSLAKVETRDATGANPVVLENMTTDVPNGQAGRRILLATPNFANYTNIPLVADFIMDPIPASYLAAGTVRFMDNGTSVYWSLSWGGSAYTGSTTGVAGVAGNDADGNFGPPVDMALPSTTLQALQFTGASNALSTNNLAQYALTAGAATFINNANTSFTLVAPEPESADYDEDGDVDGNDFLVWQRGQSPDALSAGDLALWQEQYGTAPPLTAATVAIPEPWSLTLLVCGLGLIASRR
jgi:hypothetical protein